MAKRRSPPNDRKSKNTRGNFVSEWFGQRVFPVVRLDVKALRRDACPFLSDVLEESTACVKNENSKGVCTISSASNGPRQDWLVCPYRVIDTEIVTGACERIFRSKLAARPTAASLLANSRIRDAFQRRVAKAGVGYLFFQDKLGGEISVLGTNKSPEIAFDITVVEIRYVAGRFVLERYGILEVQTMDFHGSYKKAVSNLRDALRLHKSRFSKVLSANLSWTGEGVEGPNIANVFKRTFYQVMLKFELGRKGAAAGTVLAIPQSVWDSWQPFLGAPALEAQGNGTFVIGGGAPTRDSGPNAHICVFDLDVESPQPISDVRIKQFIRVSPEQLSHHAFSVVPENMLEAVKGEGSILAIIKARLRPLWPEVEIPGDEENSRT